MTIHASTIEWFPRFAIDTETLHYPRIYEGLAIPGSHELQYGAAVVAKEVFSQTNLYGEADFRPHTHPNRHLGLLITNFRGERKPTVTESKGRYDILRQLFEQGDVRNKTRDSMLVKIPARLIIQPYRSKLVEDGPMKFSVHELIVNVEDIKP